MEKNKILKDLKHYFDNTPKEKIKKIGKKQRNLIK